MTNLLGKIVIVEGQDASIRYEIVAVESHQRSVAVTNVAGSWSFSSNAQSSWCEFYFLLKTFTGSFSTVEAYKCKLIDA